jgi:hypothetical protein
MPPPKAKGRQHISCTSNGFWERQNYRFFTLAFLLKKQFLQEGIRTMDIAITAKP